MSREIPWHSFLHQRILMYICDIIDRQGATSINVPCGGMEVQKELSLAGIPGRITIISPPPSSLPPSPPIPAGGLEKMSVLYQQGATCMS